MIKKILLGVLILSFILEIALTALAFIKPERAIAMFKVSPTAGTEFLAFITSWFLLLVSALCVLAIYLLVKEKAGYVPLIYLMGIWWIGIGIGIYFVSGMKQNLYLDTVKGLILCILNFIYTRQRSVKLS